MVSMVLENFFFQNVEVSNSNYSSLSLSSVWVSSLYFPLLAGPDTGSLSDSRQLWSVASAYFSSSEWSGAASRVFLGNVSGSGLYDGLPASSSTSSVNRPPASPQLQCHSAFRLVKKLSVMLTSWWKLTLSAITSLQSVLIVHPAL